MWWGSFGKGAFYYENGVFTDINEKFKNRNTDFPYYIRRITEDKLGNIWLATYTQGVYCLDKEGKFTNYNISNSTLLTNYIADLSYSDGQYLYIATSSGIYSIDIVTRIMTIIGTDKSGNAILRSNSANCIYKDSRNLLWIGEQEGISIHDVLNNRVEYLSLDNGLSSIFTHSICEDENNNIWLATDNGITHICIRKDNDNYEYHCFPYYKEDYIENFKFNNFSILRNSNNDIIIGGNGGFVKINPGFSDFRHDPNNILFTDLYLANEHISVGKETTDGRVLLPRNIQMLDEITLNYSDSHFALEVSAMDYINQHKRHYEYRLGNRDEWIKLERNRIYFNRLSPGLHTLYVKVAGLETNSSNTVKTLTIIVKPPFWLSPFAYAIYI